MENTLNEVSQYLKLMIGLISIVNPIGAIPMFLSLTEAYTPSQRSRIGSVASLSVAIIAGAVGLYWGALLEGLGISIPSFRIAGGILILLMALNMLKDGRNDHKQRPEDAFDAQASSSIAVVPISMPLLAGPGAISTVIVFSQQAKEGWHHVNLLVSIAVVGAVVWLCLKMAPLLARLLGPVGMRVMTRIMGLLLAAIGVEFITAGLLVSFPGLKG